MDKQNNLFEKVDEISQDVKDIKSINKDKLNYDEDYYINFINTSNIEMIWQVGSKNELVRQKKKYIISRIFYIIPLAITIWCCTYSLYNLITLAGILIAFSNEVYRMFYMGKFERVMPYIDYKTNKIIKIEYDDYGLPENIKIKPRYICNIVLLGSIIANTLILLLYGKGLYCIIPILSSFTYSLFNLSDLNFLTIYRAVFVRENEKYGSWQLYNLIKKNNIQINK